MVKFIANRIWTFLILIIWIILFINVNIFAIAEGLINPVVDEVYIEKVGDNLVYGSINKLRSCEFIGMEWFIKMNNGNYKKINTNIDQSEIDYLAQGKHIIGPMKINIDENDINNSRLRVYHKCENNSTFTKNTITIVKVNT